jgi:hypothetical protein
MTFLLFVAAAHLGSLALDALFIHGVVTMLRTSLLTDAWDNWGYGEGRSMRFPSGLNGPCSNERVYCKKSYSHYYIITAVILAAQ